MAFPVYDRSGWRCRVHPYLYSLYPAFRYSGHDSRVCDRAPLVFQCSAGVQDAVWRQTLANNRLSRCCNLDDYSWFLCRGGRLVPSVSHGVFMGAVARRCSLCEPVFCGFLHTSHSPRMLDDSLYPIDPCRSGEGGAQRDRTHFQPAYARIVCTADSTGHCLL